MPDDEPTTPDPLNLIDAMIAWREELRGMVTALTADGWSEQQARDLVVAMQKQSAKATT